MWLTWRSKNRATWNINRKPQKANSDYKQIIKRSLIQFGWKYKGGVGGWQWTIN